MLMSEAGKGYSPKDKYMVVLPDSEYLILAFGQTIDKPAFKFDHPNVVARRADLFEFKHYRQNGSKFWTRKAGAFFYLVIPTNRIEMAPKTGFSWVPVIINGVEVRLNVSGGTVDGGKGWEDWVQVENHATCNLPLKAMKAIAEVALTPEECKAKGIMVDVKTHSPESFAAKATEHECRKNLKVDQFIAFAKGFRFSMYEKIELAKISNLFGRKQYCYVWLEHGKGKLPFADVDWPRTARLNHMNVITHENFNFNRLALACA